jgi:hypothetical protein
MQITGASEAIQLFVVRLRALLSGAAGMGELECRVGCSQIVMR